LLKNLKTRGNYQVKSKREFFSSESNSLGHLGGQMDLSFLGNVNWEVVAQLSMLAAVVLAGPIVIFALAALKGDL